VRAPERAVLETLARDGLITCEPDATRTTRRWQSSMMRAIARRMRTGGDEVDVRYVVADALLEIYGADISEEALATAVEAMTHVELDLLRINPPRSDKPAAAAPPGK
jgi:hypothetical protein